MHAHTHTQHTHTHTHTHTQHTHTRADTRTHTPHNTHTHTHTWAMKHTWVSWTKTIMHLNFQRLAALASNYENEHNRSNKTSVRRHNRLLNLSRAEREKRGSLVMYDMPLFAYSFSSTLYSNSILSISLMLYITLTHARTHARTHKHTHTDTHTHTHAAHTHTHTHTWVSINCIFIFQLLFLKS